MCNMAKRKHPVDFILRKMIGKLEKDRSVVLEFEIDKSVISRVGNSFKVLIQL